MEPDVEKLISVVRLLPARSAIFLANQDVSHQEMIVRQISTILDFWEVNHVRLDPVQYEFVLDSIVFTLSSVVIGFEQAVADVARELQPSSPAGQDCAELHEDQGTG